MCCLLTFCFQQAACGGTQQQRSAGSPAMTCKNLRTHETGSSDCFPPHNVLAQHLVKAESLSMPLTNTAGHQAANRTEGQTLTCRKLLLQAGLPSNSGTEQHQLYHGTEALCCLQAKAARGRVTKAPGKALLAHRQPAGNCHLLKVLHCCKHSLPQGAAVEVPQTAGRHPRRPTAVC